MTGYCHSAVPSSIMEELVRRQPAFALACPRWFARTYLRSVWRGDTDYCNSLVSTAGSFFADQFMWGFVVERAGVGPRACPIHKLTVDILADSFQQLASHELQERAKALAAKMALEDGIRYARKKSPPPLFSRL